MARIARLIATRLGQEQNRVRHSSSHSKTRSTRSNIGDFEFYGLVLRETGPLEM